MKKLFSLILVGMLAVSGLSAKVKLSVLYVGGTANMDPILMSPGSVDSVALAASVKERMAHFTKFLKKNFTNVKSIEGKDYTPEMSAANDVTVFDGRPVPFMKGDRMRGERDSYLPESFDCAAVMIGHMSEELGRSLGNKNDWYCLCLDNYALGMKNEHPVFNGPFIVDMTTEMRPTAAPALEVAEMMGESLPKEMPMLLMHPNWTEEENASGNCRIGMVSRPGGYLDSPDTEVISGGLCGMSIDAGAIGRHGYLFHFGFAADPERLLVLPLFAQEATQTRGAVVDLVKKTLKEVGSSHPLTVIAPWFDRPEYIAALAASVRQKQIDLAKTRLIASFHSIPIKKSDTYFRQCEATVRLLEKALNLKPGSVKLAFQSKFGFGHWLEPSLKDVLQQEARQGSHSVAVLCPGFAADCLETLEEVAVTLKAAFLSEGGRHFEYIPALGSGQNAVALYAKVVREALEQLKKPVSDPK